MLHLAELPSTPTVRVATIRHGPLFAPSATRVDDVDADHDEALTS